MVEVFVADGIAVGDHGKLAALSLARAAGHKAQQHKEGEQEGNKFLLHGVSS